MRIWEELSQILFAASNWQRSESPHSTLARSSCSLAYLSPELTANTQFYSDDVDKRVFNTWRLGTTHGEYMHKLKRLNPSIHASSAVSHESAEKTSVKKENINTCFSFFFFSFFLATRMFNLFILIFVTLLA